MSTNQEILLFANQYIIMLKRMHIKIATRNCEQIYEGIHCDLFRDIFYLHYRAVLHHNAETRSSIERICKELFGFTRTTRSISPLQCPSMNPFIKTADLQNPSFVQLLLIMELISIEDKKTATELRKYLVKWPISVFEKEHSDDQANSSPKRRITVPPKELAVLDFVFEKYTDILNPVEYPEYRIDFCKAKSFYANIFYQYLFQIKQGGWNAR